MELILISNTKLKIMLDESDMRQYKISDDTDCAQPAARKAIRSILDTARERVGFNTEGAEIFVQLYTSKKGGCELFVSKIRLTDPVTTSTSDLEEAQVKEVCSSEKKLRRRNTGLCQSERKKESVTDIQALAVKPASTQSLGCGRIAFSFPSIDSLFSVCRTLKKNGILPDSRAYADFNGNFYLILFNTGMSAYSRLDKLTFILEYGKRENPDSLSTYMNEHGREICGERAIETLCNF